MDDVDYYAVLQLEKNCTQKQIKRAWHQLAPLHPDKGASGDIFITIHRAYTVLSDPYQRYAYDTYGEEGLEAMGNMKRSEHQTKETILAQIDESVKQAALRSEVHTNTVNTFGHAVVAIHAFRLFGFADDDDKEGKGLYCPSPLEVYSRSDMPTPPLLDIVQSLAEHSTDFTLEDGSSISTRF